jgi:XRE family transcriptional regulator, fatty acid utilization regulator
LFSVNRGTHAAKRRKRRPTTQDGRRLKRRRVLAGLTIRELHEQAGVAIGTISMAERGLQSLHVDTLRQLAKALGCEIADLLADDFPNGNAA